MLQFEAVDWAAGKRVDHSLQGPSNERQLRECAPSKTTNAQDLMRGKRYFPWPNNCHSSLSMKTHSNGLSASDGVSKPLTASIHYLDRDMGIRWDVLTQSR